MDVIHLDSLDDPRLLPYRNLRRTNWTRWSGWFVAEGRRVVERLVRSPFPVESVLISQRRLAWLEGIAAHLDPRVPVLVLPHSLAQQLVGYNFHTGILACGRRLPQPSLDHLAQAPAPFPLILVGTKLENPDNLGTLIRVASGFGCRGMLLGQGSADPFSRRVLRVSMGQSLFLPLRITASLIQELQELRRRWGYRLLAAEVTPQAAPLEQVHRKGPVALLLGNEDQGVPQQLLRLCDQVAQVPMHDLAPSLNVAIAGAIFVYHLTRA